MYDTGDLNKARTSYEIARRAIALHCVIAAAHGVPREEISEWLEQEHLWDEITPRELAFFNQDEHPKKEIIWMTWLVEAQVSLLWSIGKLEKLPSLIHPCDTGLIIANMPNLFDKTSYFINSSVLRNTIEIDQELDVIYDAHCRVNQAVRDGEAISESYKNVIFFRHYGFNWVSGYCGQSWDEVTPDT